MMKQTLITLFCLLSMSLSIWGDLGAKLTASYTHIQPGTSQTIFVDITMQPNWHTYGPDAGPFGKPINVQFEPISGLVVGDIQWPPTHPFTFLGQKGQGYTTHVQLPLLLTASPDLVVNQTLSLTAKVSWLECEAVCIPKQQTVVLSLPVSTTPYSASNAVAQASSNGATAPTPPPTSPTSLLIILSFAFLGGLLLNIMPCVFPVLSLKALSLINHSDGQESRIKKQALAYTIGVISSFWLLATCLMILKRNTDSVGWGYQLQSPLLISVLIAIMLYITLLFLDLVPTPKWLASLSSFGPNHVPSDSLKSHFLTGFLATLVASPCTGPYMAPALGVAFLQPPAITLLIFTGLGLGMAFPFLIIGWIPQSRAFLPKPGPWLVKAKKILAIPMALTVIWLSWVLYHQVLPTSVSSTKAPVFTQQLLNDHIAQNTPFLVKGTAAWCLTCQVNDATTLNTPEIKALLKEKNITLLIADWTNENEDIADFLHSFEREGVPLYVLYIPGEAPEIWPQILTKSWVKNRLNTLPSIE